MLRYVYGGHLSASNWEIWAKELLEAADKYGLKSLKIEAEAWYVKYLQLTVDSAIEELVYAEKMNCFLLKEAAMDFILKNSKEVIASDSFKKMPETKSIMKELLMVATMNMQDDDKKDLEEPTKLSINELRAKLDSEGGDIDGSRETMLAQLKHVKL